MMRLIITITLCFSALSVYAQNGIKQAFESLDIHEGMYDITGADQSIAPIKAVKFPYKEWGDKIDIRPWKDYRLTEKDENPEGNCILYRRFAANDFYIGIIMVSNGDTFRKILVTANKNGQFVGQIEVNAGGYDAASKRKVSVKDFSVQGGKSVFVKWEVPREHKYFGASAYLGTLFGQHIYTLYKIDQYGKISQYSEQNLGESRIDLGFFLE